MEADGTNPRRLTDSLHATGPVWSPDGAQIAYEGRIDGNNDIFVMDAEGSSVTRLTQHEANDFRPTWSPDGTQIAFYSKREGTYDLFLMDGDGSNLTRLTDAQTHEAGPAWSPGDGKLLFVRMEQVDAEERALGLYVLDLTSKQQTRLTTGSEREAIWSPDASKIAYVVDEAEGMGLYVMDADGTHQKRLLPPRP
jgi:Tol biopolymer transport system component